MNYSRAESKKTKLAQAVSSSILPRPNKVMLGLMMGASVVAPQAYSQTTDQALEEIVVTGIRGSLKRAVDLKRNASGVVDAISAEDMGVFPDTNLAESLQRITGVSIERSRGEGSKVTVRGFGPQFNLVTLNGRQMPTHIVPLDGAAITRSFDFADIASEGIAGVEVYKTGKAHVSSGGIGSTINIKTAKPLESPGLKSVVSLKAVNDKSTTNGSDLTPEVSGIYSNTFLNDTVGIAVSASYQERDSGVNSGYVSGWRSFNASDDATWGGLPRDGAQTNRPSGDDVYSVPQAIGYQFEEFSRERINSQVTLQWQASEALRATVDYTYSKNEVDRTYNNYSAWFNFGGQVTEYTDGPIASPSVYTEFPGGGDFAVAGGKDGTVAENDSIGLNLDWQVNDRLAMEFDYHNSTSEQAPNNPLGDTALLSTAVFTRERTTAYFDGELPILNVGLNAPLNPNDVILAGSVFTNNISKMDIEQAKIAGDFDFNDSTSINFGVQLTEVNNRSATSVVQRNDWGGSSQPGDLADLITLESSQGRFDQISNGNDPRRQTDYYTFDIDQVIARSASLGVTNSTAGDCGTGLCSSSTFTSDLRTQEDTQAAFIQINMDRSIGEIPVNITAGLRYEKTDVESRALAPTYSSIVQTGGNEFDAVLARDANGNVIQSFTLLTGEYDAVLPNLDIKFDLSESLVARASYSKTLSRPNYNDIQGGLTIDSLVRVNGGTGSRGNPDLQPFESDNIDLSLEYYFGDADYASFGYFKKDVKNFIGTSSVNEVLFADLIHPATGAPATFNVTVPVNQREASLDGWEFALQKTFGDSGFGFIVNATLVNGDVAYDNSSLGSQFVLPGLSDSANAIGFYDKDNVQVRIAYNWRDDFFNGNGQPSVGAVAPTFVEAFGQWDVSASYDFNDNLTFFVEGLNITEETVRTYGRAEQQVLTTLQTGARYNLGLRYNF